MVNKLNKWLWPNRKLKPGDLVFLARPFNVGHMGRIEVKTLFEIEAIHSNRYKEEWSGYPKGIDVARCRYVDPIKRQNQSVQSYNVLIPLNHLEKLEGEMAEVLYG